MRYLVAAALIGGMLLAQGTPSDQERTFHWPNGARAAVCLTYDDCIPGDLDKIAPDLEAAKLHGTFFVVGSAAPLYKRMDEWRSLVQRGHELGNHAMFHPCQQVVNGHQVRTVPPERALDNYTVRRMIDELQAMNTLLFAIDRNRNRTFAYPCGNGQAGGESYVPGLRPLFTAARAVHVDGEIIAPDMQSLDIHLVPSWTGGDVTGEFLLALVKKALDKGTLAVFAFHGIGGGHPINIDREEHRKLLTWLAANKDQVWTDTFFNVTQHILKERERLGWKNPHNDAAKLWRLYKEY
jgi:sialate O-acetylesterase